MTLPLLLDRMQRIFDQHNVKADPLQALIYCELKSQSIRLFELESILQHDKISQTTIAQDNSRVLTDVIRQFFGESVAIELITVMRQNE